VLGMAAGVVGHAVVADLFAPLLVLTRRGRPEGVRPAGPNNPSTPANFIEWIACQIPIVEQSVSACLRSAVCLIVDARRA
jgi:hypothetical protein